MVRTPSVLLVEDNRNDVELIEDAFRETGIDARFIHAHDAAQAFRYLLMGRRQPPDLIILDLNLPIIRGHAILRELKAHAPWNAVPVIVFSSSSLGPDIAGAKELGATEYLVKRCGFDGYLALARCAGRHLRAAGHQTRGEEDGSPAWLAPFLALDELAWPSDEVSSAAG